MNYFEHHIGDYLKDTAHLSLLEHGIYRRLMDVYYTRESAIPAAEVARLIGARSRDEKEALQAVLGEFFVLQDDRWTQARCDAEIARFQDKQRKAKASADARWSKTDRNANASEPHDAADMRTHSEGNATRARPQSPDTNPQTPSTRGKKDSRVAALAVADLVGSGLTEQTAAEFLALRKRKAAPLTERAWQGICTEASRAGWSPEQAVCKSLARGWTGFEAAWVAADSAQSTGRRGPRSDADLAAANAASTQEAHRRLFGGQQETIDA